MAHQEETPAVAVPTRAKLHLPPAPEHLTGPVKAWREPVDILTFAPDAPDKNPMFLERRVYQGSSGRVYPLPFYDRISAMPEVRTWDAYHIENEYVRLMILPEIGGRIHVGFDKRSGYDFFYRQNVIRPALVGLAGPWISGGVEFNWPQHHRPATYMPAHAEIESREDGSVTIWCSDHDPMLRMKGMHGVMLRPGCARVDLNVRLYNRTPYTQTFLWWANVATRVHEHYQSFFPADVAYVADHAKRAITSFPFSDRPYYGVDYAARAIGGVPADEVPSANKPDGSYPANDLSRFANIPVPTSYMVTHTEEDFFGGYDHREKAGVVHVANHHIVPGKKQWTWGNHEFGYAWDRSLTLEDGPYIELMAGAYTDNQPDFSFLTPWETKTFTQSWFPLHGIGVPQTANLDAALHVEIASSSVLVQVQVTRNLPHATILVRRGDEELQRWESPLSVEELFERRGVLPADTSLLTIEVLVEGRTLIAYAPFAIRSSAAPEAAVEPPAPEKIASVEELYLTGLHLEQYRHATRDPLPYWQEALRIDPGHSDSHNAVGLWHLRRGEFAAAEVCFAKAVRRLTFRNPNPRNGEPYYNLGLALRLQSRNKAAYDALYKATWNSAWRGPAYFALAEIDASRGDDAKALEHIEQSLSVNTDLVHARNLKAKVLLRLGRASEAQAEWAKIEELDPLDLHLRWRKEEASLSGQEALDLAFDSIRCGDFALAHQVLRTSVANASDGSLPMLLFTLAHIADLQGEDGTDFRQQAADSSLDYCFPSRIEEQVVLQATLEREPGNLVAEYLLGLFWYDRRRHTEATALWESVALGLPLFSTVWRNLGIARFNIAKDVDGSMEAFDRALACAPEDGRILYERDQLWKRIARSAETRLQELEKHSTAVQLRDDLAVEFATLLNQVGRPAEALALLLHRTFQPWEGGEGLVLQQYLRARMLLAKMELTKGRSAVAVEHLESCFEPPPNLSEAKHLLANWAHVDYWLGVAYAAEGREELARTHWQRAADRRGDFQQMAVKDISSMTYWSGMAQLQLGHIDAATLTFGRVAAFADKLEATPPSIDYFATSLPTMLLFEEDLSLRNLIDVLLLRAQAALGMAQLGTGTQGVAESHLRRILQLDPSHVEAADLLAELLRDVVVA